MTEGLRAHGYAARFPDEGILVAYANAPARGSIFDKSGLDDFVRVGRLFDDVFARLGHVPGVISAGGAMGLPTGQYDSNGSYAVEGQQTFGGDFRRLPSAGFRLASPGYFRTMTIPLLRGREFDDGDLYERPFVAIVSESLARQSFGTGDPIGHRIMCGLDSDKWMTIVGVVGDVRQASPASPPGPELYMPLRQHPYAANYVQMVMRTSAPPESLIGAVRQTVRSRRPDVALKFTSEFGLRVALGAKTGDVVRLVLRGAARLVAVGVVLGLALALVTSRIITSMLFGITPVDTQAYAGALLVALPLVFLAAIAPAMRAARVDPMIVLREP